MCEDVVMASGGRIHVKMGAGAGPAGRGCCRAVGALEAGGYPGAGAGLVGAGAGPAGVPEPEMGALS